MQHGRGRSYIVQRFSLSTAQRLGARLRARKAFSVFVVDGDLRTVDYPGERYHGLMADHGHAIVGTYIDMPPWATLAEDVDATLYALAKAAGAAAAP